MKKLIFVMLLILLSYSYAGALTSCQIIDKEGGYTLSTDITGAPNPIRLDSAYLTSCIVIKANNVNLNCNNYKIKNSDKQLAVGIFVDNAEDISINNCNISNFSVSKNSFGILAIDSERINITNNHLANNYAGIFVKESSEVQISANYIMENQAQAIYLSRVNQSQVFDNQVRKNEQEGILVLESGDLIIKNNIISESETGLSASDSNNLTVQKNEIFTNKVDGIEAYSISNSIVQNNKIYSNNHGQYFLFSKGIQTSDNVIYNNEIGIEIDSSQMSLTNDVIYKNNQDLRVQASKSAPSAINIMHMTFDEPNKKKTLKISIQDQANEPYTITGTYIPATPLVNTVPLADRYAQITAGALLFIDRISFETQEVTQNGTLIDFKNGGWQEIPSALSLSENSVSAYYLRNSGTYGIFESGSKRNQIDGVVSAKCNYSKVTLSENGAPVVDAVIKLNDGSEVRYSDANGIAEFNSCGNISAQKEGYLEFSYAPKNWECSCGEQIPDISNPQNVTNTEKPNYSFEFFDVTSEAFSVRILENTEMCKNCIYQMTDPSGMLLDNITTDYSGIVHIKNPKSGVYMFQINKNGTIRTSSYEFRPKVQNQDSNNGLILIGVLVIILVGAGVYYAQNRERHKRTK